jgi:haloalkane dehalogenase
MALFRAEAWQTKKYVEVLGARMAYLEAGTGRPVVFLHGNPTSSILWRKVIPAVAKRARCIAPDLIGMGDSSKVGSGGLSYRFLDHRTYLDALFELLGLSRDVVLVGHEWGGPLLFDWAQRNRAAVAGIVYMETFVTPLGWPDLPESAVDLIRAVRTDAGEGLVLGRNRIVERLIPIGVSNPLPDQIMEEYRRPYTMSGEDRRATLTLAREIPIEGEPAAVADIVRRNETWLQSSPVKKLFIDADPGFYLTGRAREMCRAWPVQSTVTVPGIHLIQEDSGAVISNAIAQWLETL